MLLHLAEGSQDIRRGLRAAGLLSCFADEEWMHSTSTPSEWEEYERVRRAYAEEVVFSKSVFAILMSNPGQYPWRTALIAAKVRERFERYGDVHALFADPARRHLVELTAPPQRLMKMLNGTPAAALNARNGIYDEFRAGELDATVGVIADVRRALSASGLDEVTLKRYFLDTLCMRAFGTLPAAEALVSGPEGLELHLRAGTDAFIGIRPDGDLAGKGAKLNGAFYAQLFVRQAPGMSAVESFSNADMIHYARALRGNFSVYSRFSSRAELAVSCAAWIEALVLTLRHLNATGCGVRLAGS